MHFHLPKPLRGWREFLGEIAIIVMGVLIALAAEQSVEAWHEHNQAEDGRMALRAELGTDDLPQAYARLAVAPCVDGKLAELQAALDAQSNRKAILVLAKAYNPPLRTWDDQAWNAVVASGVLAHAGSRELVRWSSPYRMIAVLRPRSETEREDTVALRSISSQPGNLTSAERDRATVALERLRSDEQIMVADSEEPPSRGHYLGRTEEAVDARSATAVEQLRSRAGDQTIQHGKPVLVAV